MRHRADPAGAGRAAPDPRGPFAAASDKSSLTGAIPGTPSRLLVDRSPSRPHYAAPRVGGGGRHLPACSREVLQGFRDERASRAAREAMLPLPAVKSPLGIGVFEEAEGLDRAARRREMTVQSPVDCLIAACAVRNGLTVLALQVIPDHGARAGRSVPESAGLNGSRAPPPSAGPVRSSVRRRRQRSPCSAPAGRPRGRAKG